MAVCFQKRCRTAVWTVRKPHSSIHGVLSSSAESGFALSGVCVSQPPIFDISQLGPPRSSRDPPYIRSSPPSASIVAIHFFKITTICPADLHTNNNSAARIHGVYAAATSFAFSLARHYHRPRTRPNNRKRALQGDRAEPNLPSASPSLVSIAREQLLRQ